MSAAKELPVQCNKHSFRFHISSISCHELQGGFKAISVAELTLYDIQPGDLEWQNWPFANSPKQM